MIGSLIRAGVSGERDMIGDAWLNIPASCRLDQSPESCKIWFVPTGWCMTGRAPFLAISKEAHDWQ